MTHQSPKLPSVIEPGEQELEPKNNSLVYEKNKKHGVGIEDAFTKFELELRQEEEQKGDHIVTE